MGEPVLRLVIPDKGGDRDKAAPWQAAGQPPAAEVAPSAGATDGATTTTAAGATTRATTGATSPAAGPGAGATREAAEGATNAAAGGAGVLPELRLPGRPMTAGERAARLARHWLASVREAAMRPGELPHAVWHGKPESLAELHDYAVSRAWVPDGHEGSLAPALGALYSHTVAKGGAVLGLFIAWVTARALRLTVFLLIAGVLTVLIIAFS